MSEAKEMVTAIAVGRALGSDLGLAYVMNKLMYFRCDGKATYLNEFLNLAGMSKDEFIREQTLARSFERVPRHIKSCDCVFVAVEMSMYNDFRESRNWGCRRINPKPKTPSTVAAVKFQEPTTNVVAKSHSVETNHVR